jgi:hypothetical protein
VVVVQQKLDTVFWNYLVEHQFNEFDSEGN